MRVKFIYNDVEYTLDQNLGNPGIYLSSKGFVKSGTVREIHDRLFSAIPYSYDTTDWKLVSGQDTSLETFKKKIINRSCIVDKDFEIWYSTIESKRKASIGDVIEFNGHLFKCTRCWTEIPFFRYHSRWTPITRNGSIEEERGVIDAIKAKLLKAEDGQPTI